MYCLVNKDAQPAGSRETKGVPVRAAWRNERGGWGETMRFHMRTI